MTTPASAQDSTEDFNGDALLRAVERLGLLLTEAGMPRMPARVFAYVLAEDADRYTARELAEGLRVSPAAISGAVRYLVQVGLLDKGRDPESRSDHYRIYDDDVWSAIAAQRLPLLQRWEEIIGVAVQQLPKGSRGRRRVLETQAYYRFLCTEMPRLTKRWREQRQHLVAQLDRESR